jgi:hypothetical protein
MTKHLTVGGLPHVFFMGYPLVGGTRSRHFDGTNSKTRKLLENAATPTTLVPAHFAGDRLHAVLGENGHSISATANLSVGIIRLIILSEIVRCKYISKELSIIPISTGIINPVNPMNNTIIDKNTDCK